MEIDHELIHGYQWEVELAPVMLEIEGEPTARPAAVLIVANGVVLSSEIVPHAPSEPEEIGVLLADHVAATAQQRGYAPPSVGVRFREVARVMRQRLAPLGVAVRCKRRLPGLDDAATSLRQELLGIDGPSSSVSSPWMWGGWGIPSADIEEIFEAAAHFHRLHPWSVFGDDVILALEFPNGTTWHASVFEDSGEIFGLSLFESLSEFRGLLALRDWGTVMSAMESMTVALSFHPRADLPDAMQDEIDDAGWPVAGPGAYPLLSVTNTPGGGLTRERAWELCAALRAIAGYAIAWEIAVVSASDEVHEWLDESAGIVIRYLGRQFPSEPPLWDEPDCLTTSLAEGPRANPRALLDADGVSRVTDAAEFSVLDRFRGWLRETGAPEHGVQRDVRNADAFLQCLVEMVGVRLVAVTEYDLRLVLYDLYIRRFGDSRTVAMTMRGSLRRFFRFLGEREGIECPWAQTVLREHREFEARYDSFPRGDTRTEQVQAWQERLYADLTLRALHLAPDLTISGATPGILGDLERRLLRQMHRELLICRDEAIRAGMTDASSLLARLYDRQLEWELQRRPELGGRTAREVMSEERNRIWEERFGSR